MSEDRALIDVSQLLSICLSLLCQSVCSNNNTRSNPRSRSTKNSHLLLRRPNPHKQQACRPLWVVTGISHAGYRF
ncbi:hypothetical protein EDC01DRAFT_678161 [Geopyxis carbonaria]|nr:hypothetical protein EDC01DRAFT_678161 [Geopyxis carbonaria]